ncbi:MAG: phosphoglycerate kinase [Anaerolineae bacterium]|jgi:phosphoglycerate kinase|nr:phosphoglycerate kinase [Chloroflexota bacterium]
MAKKTVQDVDVRGKRVLVRCDFNVPLDKNQQITDDLRIRAALPTLQYLLEHGAAVILCSHLGRPKGKVVEEMRLTPVAARLQELLGVPVCKTDTVVGDDVTAAVAAMQPGDVVLLENTRFEAGDEKNDPELSRKLASLADLFVNDAFGAAHRAHASTAGVADYIPAVSGLLMGREVQVLGDALSAPVRPLVVILGGAKISDKIGVIENLLNKADRILIGGGMANTFFAAKGYDLGDSLVEPDAIATAADLMARAGDRLMLPVDAVLADAFSAEANTRVALPTEVGAGWRILDIGPRTVEVFSEVIAQAGTVIWNGPMGVFEMAPFAKGTFAIARALAASKAMSIVGGGDSGAAVQESGVADQIDHISTGGGASLEFLEGLELPGVAALQEK